MYASQPVADDAEIFTMWGSWCRVVDGEVVKVDLCRVDAVTDEAEFWFFCVCALIVGDR